MSNIGDVLGGVYTALSSGLPDDVQVADGPELSGAHKNRMVFVGYSGDGDFDLQAALGTQEWAEVGGRNRRNENVTVSCTLVVIRGQKSPSAVRDEAVALFQDVESALTASDLGLGVPVRSILSRYRLFHEPTERGMQVRITFDVSVFSRVSS